MSTLRKRFVCCYPRRRWAVRLLLVVVILLSSMLYQQQQNSNYLFSSNDLSTRHSANRSTATTTTTATNDTWTMSSSGSFTCHNTIQNYTRTTTIKNNPKHHSRPQQRIVILPGPHKTGTTSVQSALVHWIRQAHSVSNSDDDDGHNAFASWAWPVPNHTPHNNDDETPRGSSKSFQLVMGQLMATKRYNANSTLIRSYRQAISSAWKEGYDIVVAAESLDRLVQEDNANPSKESQRSSVLLERLWDLVLPLSSSTTMTPQVTIGIHHRTPRSDQMISLWHQLGKRHESLSSFLTKQKQGLMDYRHNLNSVGLANLFASTTAADVDQVILISTEGVQQVAEEIGVPSMDLPTAVACHVLQVPCSIVLPKKDYNRHSQTQSSSVLTNSSKQSSCEDAVRIIDDDDDNLLSNNHITRSSSQTRPTAPVLNHREDVGLRDVDPAILERIELWLQEYDCYYLMHLLLPQPKVELVYFDHLLTQCEHLQPGATSSKRTKKKQTTVLFPTVISRGRTNNVQAPKIQPVVERIIRLVECQKDQTVEICLASF